MPISNMHKYVLENYKDLFSNPKNYIKEFIANWEKENDVWEFVMSNSWDENTQQELYQEFEDIAKERFFELIEQFEYYSDPFIVYRNLIVFYDSFVDRIQKGMESGNLEDVGVYWTWDKDSARAIWGDRGMGDEEVTLIAKVDKINVDWWQTLIKNTHPTLGEDENEILLIEGSEVIIIKIIREKEAEDFKGEIYVTAHLERINFTVINKKLNNISLWLKEDSWKEEFPNKVSIHFTNDELKFIKYYLLELRLTLVHPYNRNYYQLSDSGEETLKDIISNIDAKKDLTEYQIGFLAFWLYRVSKGRSKEIHKDNPINRTASKVILLEIMNKCYDSVKNEKIKKEIRKIREKTEQLKK